MRSIQKSFERFLTEVLPCLTSEFNSRPSSNCNVRAAMERHYGLHGAVSSFSVFFFLSPFYLPRCLLSSSSFLPFLSPSFHCSAQHVFLSSPLFVLAILGAAVGRSNDELYLSFSCPLHVRSERKSVASILACPPINGRAHTYTDSKPHNTVKYDLSRSLWATTTRVPSQRDWAVFGCSHMQRQEGTSMTNPRPNTHLKSLIERLPQ